MREPITLEDCKYVLNYIIPQINGEDLVDRQELNNRLETRFYKVNASYIKSGEIREEDKEVAEFLQRLNDKATEFYKANTVELKE